MLAVGEEFCSSEETPASEVCDDSGLFPKFLAGVDFLHCDKPVVFLIGGWRRDTASAHASRAKTQAVPVPDRLRQEQ